MLKTHTLCDATSVLQNISRMTALFFVNMPCILSVIWRRSYFLGSYLEAILACAQSIVLAASICVCDHVCVCVSQWWACTNWKSS